MLCGSRNHLPAKRTIVIEMAVILLTPQAFLINQIAEFGTPSGEGYPIDVALRSLLSQVQSGS